MQVIIVPADESEPCRIETVSGRDWHDDLRALIGAQAIDRGVYDRDAVLQIDGNGAGYRPANRRATRYAFGQSEAAARHRTDPDDPPYQIHGDVAVLGVDQAGEPVDTPPARLRALFGIA